MFILCGVNQWTFLDFYWLKLISLLQSFDISKENKVFYSLDFQCFDDSSRNRRNNTSNPYIGLHQRTAPTLCHLFFWEKRLIGNSQNTSFEQKRYVSDCSAWNNSHISHATKNETFLNVERVIHVRRESRDAVLTRFAASEHFVVQAFVSL